MLKTNDLDEDEELINKYRPIAEDKGLNRQLISYLKPDARDEDCQIMK